MKKIILLCLIFTLHAKELQKAYIHRAPQAETLEITPQIELEKLVFYFDQKPLIRSVVHNDAEQNGWKHETFFFVLDGVSNTCKNILQDMQRETKYYRIACTEINEPRKGLRLELCYDPSVVHCVCDSCDAITQHKGVVVRIINKSFLEQLKGQQSPLIQLAAYQPHIVIDPGHGGADAGAIGCFGVKEKEVTLGVSTALAELLKKKAIA